MIIFHLWLLSAGFLNCNSHAVVSNGILSAQATLLLSVRIINNIFICINLECLEGIALRSGDVI